MRRLGLLVLAVGCHGATAPAIAPHPSLAPPVEEVTPITTWPAAPAELPATVTPLAYRLDVTIDPDQPDYRGTIDIDVEVAEPQRVIWLSAAATLTIDAATIHRGDAPPITPMVVRDGDALIGLRLPAPLTGPATLHLAFAGPFDDEVGLFRQAAGGQHVVYTDFEPSDARRAWPCFDDPRWRAPWTVTVRAPDGASAFANMPATSDAREGDTVVHQFAPTPPLPTYLVALAVGPFTAVDVPGAPVPTRIIAPPGLTGVAYARGLLGPIATATAAWVGRPWPLPKLDVVVVPEMNGAMENPGLITVASDIAVAPADGEARALVALVLAHEVAHAWFGAWVTPQSWRELWLNEGLATWVADRVLRLPALAARVDAEHVADRLEIYRIDDQRRRPLRPARLTAPREPFDQITYQKGGATLHALAAWLGDDAVRDALRGYLDARPWGVVTTDDLTAALIAIDPERPIGAALAELTGAATVPAIAVERVCDPGRALLRVTPADPDRHPLVCARWGGAAAGRACAVVTGPTAIEVGPTCPTWYLPAADGEGYARWSIARADWAALAAAPLTPAEWTSTTDAVLDALAADRIAPADAVRLLGAAVASADDVAIAAAGPWLALAVARAPATARTAVARIATAATARALAALGRSVAGAEPDHRASARARALELSGTAADDKLTRRWARRTVTAWQRGAALPPQVIGPALVVAAHHATPRARAVLIATARRTDARVAPLADALGRALTALPDAELWPVLTDTRQPLPPPVLFSALTTLVSRADRAAPLLAALPRRVAVRAPLLTPAPCAVPTPGADIVIPLEAAAAAAARCQAVAERLAR